MKLFLAYIPTEQLLSYYFGGAIIIQYFLHRCSHHKRKTNELWIALPFSTYVLTFLLGVWAYIGIFTVANGGPEIFPDIFGFGSWFGNGEYGLIFSTAILLGLGLGSIIWTLSRGICWFIQRPKDK